MLKTRVFDLKFIKFNFELHRALEWCWYYRWHFKRYVKRHIPWLKLKCDFCGEKIVTWPMSGPESFRHKDEKEWWYAGCMECANSSIMWGHYAGAATEKEALAKWIQTGGEEYLGKVSFRTPPPWLWEDDNLGLSKMYRKLNGFSKFIDA